MISIHRLSNTDQLTGLKIKIQLSAVQERYTDVVQTCKMIVSGWKKLPKKKKPSCKQVGISVFIFHKIYIEQKLVKMI